MCRNRKVANVSLDMVSFSSPHRDMNDSGILIFKYAVKMLHVSV